MNTPKTRAACIAISFAIVAVVACALPSMALAQTIASADYAVQLVAEMEQGSLGAIAVATIPESTQLPATVRIMVPKGFHPSWVGEIMGGESSQDKEIKYTEGTTDQGSYLEVTATNSRTVQAEGLVHSGLSYEGDKTVIATSITNPTNSSSALELTLVVPAAGGAPSGDPAIMGSPNTESSGKKLYNLEPTTIAGDATIAVNETYETNGGAKGATSATSQNSALPIAIVVVVLLVLVAAIVLLVRKKRSEDIYYE